MKKSSLFSIFFIGLLYLFYAGCSDSSSKFKEENIISPEHNISGKVQKGNFIDGTLTAQRVEVNGSAFGKIVSTAINDKAQYTLNLSWKGLTLLTAKGRFFNEYTGKNSTDEVELYALVNTKDKELSKKINLNLFTSLESQRVIELMKKGTSYNKALIQSKVELERIFTLSKDVNATALDIYDVNSILKKENLNLLLFSGTLLKIIEEKNLNSSNKVTKPQFKMQDMIKHFYDDFKDNGKFDRDTKDDFKKMIEEDKDKLLERLDKNLGLELDNNRDLLRDHEWYLPGDMNTSLRITKFKLKNIKVNNTSINYANQTALYMGLPKDNVKLKFTLESKSNVERPIPYTAKIYAVANGLPLLLVKSGISSGQTSNVSKVVEIEVNQALRDFFKNAYLKGKDVQFRVVTNILKTTTSFVLKDTDILPKFVGLSGTLTINGNDLNITYAKYLYKKSSNSCQDLSIASELIDSTNTVYAKFKINVNWQPSKNWNIAHGNLDNGCVRLDYNSNTNSFDITLIKENINFLTESISSIIGEGRLVSATSIENNSIAMQIDPNGALVMPPLPALFFNFYVPKDISVHIADTNQFLPLNLKYLQLFSKTLNISSNWDKFELESIYSQANNSFVYLHSKELPFFVVIDNHSTVIFDLDGLHISNVSAKYIFNSKDTTNDILFSNPIGKFNVTINKDGLQTDTPIHFGAVTDVKTHFPYTIMSQGDFNINIVNGEIAPTLNPIGLHSIGLPLTRVKSYKLSYSSECKEKSCSDDGTPSYIEYTFNSSNLYMAKDGAYMSDIDINNKKIAWGSKQNGNYIFERDSDTKGKMYLPGFSIKANEPENLIKTLLGSRDIDNGKLATVYPLGHNESKKGNGLFAGLNVGSLYLNSTKTDPLTSLANTNMIVQVGGKQKTSLTLNNNDKTKYYIRPSGITGVFNGSLEQANENLSIYGYPMTFKSFAFSQIANKLDDKTLINGNIAVINPGGFKVDFSSLALDCTGGLNGGIVDETDCTASPKINCEQKLTAWKTNTQFVSVDFQENPQDVCLDKTLRIGHVLDVKALIHPLGLTTNWKPDGSPEHAMVSGSSSNFLDRDEDNASSKGFAVTLDSGAKLINEGWYKFSGAFGLPFWGMQPVDLGLTNETNSTRALTRVMPLNKLNQNSYTQNKAQKFMASYQWGSTGLGFELPVVYNAKRANEESIFIGKKLEIDLGVMNANAGINYIKPNDTKISFGASADFEAMGKLQIKVDLNDPESIKKIDNTLDTFGIGGRPIYSTIGLVLDPLHEAEAYADKGLLLGMEELGVKALKKGANEAGIDPFELVANSMVKVHSLPIQAIDMTEDYILEKFDSKIGFAVGSIDSILEKTANDVNKTKEEALDLLNGVLTQFDSLNKIKNQLKDIEKTLTNINQTNAWNLLEPKISKIIPKQCNLLSNSELLKPVFTLRDNISSINSAIQNIPMDKIRSFASKVDSKIDYDMSFLVNSVEKTKRVSSSLSEEILNAQGEINNELDNFCTNANSIRGKIKTLIDKSSQIGEIVSKLQAYITNVQNQLDSISDIKNKIEKYRDTLSELDPTKDIPDDIKTELSSLNSISILSHINNGQNIDELKEELKGILKDIPQPTADELRSMVVTKILDTQAVADIRTTMNESLSPIMDEVREVTVELFSSVNRVIYELFDKLSDKANKALAEATSAVKAMPMKSGKMDGYALISGDELDRLHIGAEWKVDSGDKDTSYSFNGALDIQRWGDKESLDYVGCGGENSDDRKIDVKISTRNIHLTLGGKGLSVDELYFGFTLQHALPIGVVGGIESEAGFNFNKFALYDMKLSAGIGAIETYLGATTAAMFDVYQMNVAFLVGKTCGKEIITELDPEVADFITIPNNVFKGVYVRGGASFPVWNNGCALTVGVTADLGVWVLIPGTYGGLVGGGAYGKALCIASLKGQVKTMFEKSGDNMKFQGSGWGAAGAGWCSPSKWSSVAKSRRDSWCGTGDAQFGAEYNNGWKLLDIDTDAVF